MANIKHAEINEKSHVSTALAVYSVLLQTLKKFLNSFRTSDSFHWNPQTTD